MHYYAVGYNCYKPGEAPKQEHCFVEAQETVDESRICASLSEKHDCTITLIFRKELTSEIFAAEKDSNELLML